MKLFDGKIYNVIRSAVYLALAAVVIVFLQQIAEIVCLRYFIGGLIIFYGVEEIAFTAFNSRKHFSLKSIYWNAVEIVLGLTLIVLVENGEENVTYAVVCVSWATWSILRETRELVEATEHFKKKPTSALNILESLVVIALSITMIITPTEHHAEIHLYLLAVELATKVLFPMVDNSWKIVSAKHRIKHGELTAVTPDNAYTEEPQNGEAAQAETAAAQNIPEEESAEKETDT